jgi:isoleucyl-tRNA synthetase
VDDAGRFTESTGFAYAGKPVLTEGTQQVIDDLQQQRLLLHEAPITHSYPYDWRTKKPVILR